MPASTPGRTCDEITAADFEAAIKAGATKGLAQLEPDGNIWMDAGPGMKHCATYNSTMKPCARPTDFVIQYKVVAEDRLFYVKVPKGAQYRFNVSKKPNTCEIVKEAE